ncbi:MAG: hypothetical protein ACE5H4_14390 [Candidatus Thorarchaeota archaeon]
MDPVLLEISSNTSSQDLDLCIEWAFEDEGRLLGHNAANMTKFGNGPGVASLYLIFFS